jgi:hypothetical protein
LRIHPSDHAPTGDDAIQPYAILVLFFSLAYMALSLDQTGAFSWLALKMTRAAASGPRLFALHTLLAGAVTVATSNDVRRVQRGRSGGFSVWYERPRCSCGCCADCSLQSSRPSNRNRWWS